MEQMKRFIDCYIPVTTCNLRCSYCYITQTRKFKDKLPVFKYNAAHIKQALSRERLGGICHFNFCGGGETLLPPEIIPITRALLEEGHYIMIVTNGTASKRFDEYTRFPKELLARLGFKFSFHYMELKRKNLLNKFFDNIQKVRQAGCSFSVEITPYDELIPYIDEIKAICVKRVGAYCHVTIARDESTVGDNKPILTRYSREEYKKIWGVFDSPLFDFKMSVFGVKRKEYCYAGVWSGIVDMGSGNFGQCYYTYFTQNIFEDLDKPIRWRAIGRNCLQPHCYNAHAFMTLGVIPSIETPAYALLRNRLCKDGTEWLTPEMKDFLSSKLENTHELKETNDSSLAYYPAVLKVKTKALLKKVLK